MKVLMLGWEYPPHISGGLGVATQGLAEALCQYVDIQLVLPQDLQAKQVISKEITTSKKPFPTSTKLLDFQHVSIGKKTGAYTAYQASSVPSQEEISSEIKEKATAIRKATEQPSGQLLYGKALMEKVDDYAKQACKIAEESDFDVIHAHDWMTFPAAMRIKKASGKPLVVHVHSLETDRTTNTQVRNPIYKIEQKAMEKADLVIPVSEYTKHSIEQHYSAEAEKITAIHNGLSEVIEVQKSSKEPLVGKEKNKKKSKKRNILFVGRLTAQKGVETFLRTASRLLESRNDLHFTVAGLGDQLEQMMQTVEDAEIEKFIDFHGFVKQDQLANLLREADLLFMPSVSEPFGLAALEAAQFGLPIVISNQSGVIEVLPGVLTAEYWDSKTFARHISVLLDYKSIRKAFGKANKKVVKKKSWHKAAQKVNQAYQKLHSST